jgi:hypothetical protein
MIEIFREAVKFRKTFRSGSWLLAAWLIFGLCSVICAQNNDTKFYQSAGTVKMAKILREIYDAQDFKVDPNKAAERTEYYKGLLTQNLDIRSELKVRVALATELLRSGERYRSRAVFCEGNPAVGGNFQSAARRAGKLPDAP